MKAETGKFVTRKIIQQVTKCIVKNKKSMLCLF